MKLSPWHKWSPSLSRADVLLPDAEGFVLRADTAEQRRTFGAKYAARLEYDGGWPRPIVEAKADTLPLLRKRLTAQGRRAGRRAVAKPKEFTLRASPRKCTRCGGPGGAEQWRATGWTCFLCGGKGVHGTEKVRVYAASVSEARRADIEAEIARKAQARRDKARAMREEARRSVVEAKQTAQAAKSEANLREIFAQHPALAAALQLNHPIVQDIATRAVRFGSISDAQIALVFKLNRQVAEEAARRAAATPVPSDGKRQIVRGAVVKTEWQEYGPAWMHSGSLKALVAEDRGFRLWGSLPSSIATPIEPGTRVEFTAALEPSKKDPMFGFWSRPTKGAVLPARGQAGRRRRAHRR